MVSDTKRKVNGSGLAIGIGLGVTLVLCWIILPSVFRWGL